MHILTQSHKEIVSGASRGLISQKDFRHYLLIINSRNELSKSLESKKISKSDYDDGLKEREFRFEKDFSTGVPRFNLITNVAFKNADIIQKA